MPSREDDLAIRQARANHQEKTKQRLKEEHYSTPKPSGKRRQPPTKGQLKRSRARRMRNRMMYHEAVDLAADLGIELAPSSPIPDVMEKVFRRTHALWMHAASEVDHLDPDAKPGDKNSIWVVKYDRDGNRITELSKWVQYENILRQELFEQAAIGQKLNLDEAHVRIEAAQLQILGQALKNAARKAGFDSNQQKALGAALREELEIIEGQITEDPSPPALEQVA